MTRWAEGGNYRFDLERRVVTCRVWSRPDVDRETGARFAQETLAVFENLLENPRSVVSACLFDAREAPVTWGPTTHRALERIFFLWEEAGRRVAVVVGREPLQALQLRLILQQKAPRFGSLFHDPDPALDWLLESTRPPSSHRA